MRISGPESARCHDLVDVARRSDDLRVDRSHLQTAAAQLLHLGNDDVVVIGSQSCRIAAAGHVTYSHTHTTRYVTFHQSQLMLLTA